MDYDIFVNVPQLSAKNIDIVQTLFDADSLDFLLREGASAIDKGMPLLTITEGFNGDSPDLGALEYNAPMPCYGPRPQSAQAEGLVTAVQKKLNRHHNSLASSTHPSYTHSCCKNNCHASRARQGRTPSLRKILIAR